MFIVSIVGRSRVGKTTYIEALPPELARRGLRVAVAKHDAGGFEMNHPGKDTWRYAQAGSQVVAISGPDRFALIERRRQKLPLEAVAARLPDINVVLTEGYKREGRNKVELLRRAHSEEPVCRSSELIAVIADFPAHAGLPLFPLEDPVPFSDHLMRTLLGGALPPNGRDAPPAASRSDGIAFDPPDAPPAARPSGISLDHPARERRKTLQSERAAPGTPFALP